MPCCIKSAHAIVKGLEINYNFNRKHMPLDKKTPAEVAIPQLELGVNKWLDLIKLSKAWSYFLKDSPIIRKIREIAVPINAAVCESVTEDIWTEINVTAKTKNPPRYNPNATKESDKLDNLISPLFCNLNNP